MKKKSVNIWVIFSKQRVLPKVLAQYPSIYPSIHSFSMPLIDWYDWGVILDNRNQGNLTPMRCHVVLGINGIPAPCGVVWYLEIGIKGIPTCVVSCGTRKSKSRESCPHVVSCGTRKISVVLESRIKNHASIEHASFFGLYATHPCLYVRWIKRQLNSSTKTAETPMYCKAPWFTAFWLVETKFDYSYLPNLDLNRKSCLFSLPSHQATSWGKRQIAGKWYLLVLCTWVTNFIEQSNESWMSQQINRGRVKMTPECGLIWVCSASKTIHHGKKKKKNDLGETNTFFCLTVCVVSTQ